MPSFISPIGSAPVQLPSILNDLKYKKTPLFGAGDKDSFTKLDGASGVAAGGDSKAKKLKMRVSTLLGRIKAPFQRHKASANSNDPASVVPLHEQRNKKLSKISEAQYASAGQSFSHYIYKGDMPDYYSGPNPNIWPTLEAKLNAANSQIDLTKLLTHLSTQKIEALQFLDIGCGQGDFIKAVNKPGSIQAYGITAPGVNVTHFPSDQIINCNAQELVKHMSNRQNTFDLIHSQMTFLHLTDPLGALSQAYLLLKPGGIMIIDAFKIPGLENNIPEINQYFKKKGIEALFIPEPDSTLNGKVDTVILRKTDQFPKLDLPVKYNGFKKVSGAKEQKYKLDTKKIMQAQIIPDRTAASADIFESLRNLRLQIGIPDLCLRQEQDSQSQAALVERLRDTIISK